jgi:spore maturation protein CgeB
VSDSTHGPLRVAVVGPIYGGSLPITRYLMRALAELGHEPQLIDNGTFGDAWRTIEALEVSPDERRALLDALSGVAAQVTHRAVIAARPDLALFLAQAPIEPRQVDALRDAGVVTVFWFVEDFRTLPYFRGFLGHYDHFWAIQQGELTGILEQGGQRHHQYVPLACDPSVHRPRAGHEIDGLVCDLSFAGSGYPNRHRVLARMLDLGPRIYGTHWKSDEVLAPFVHDERLLGSDELARIFSASRINLNICSSLFHTELCTLTDFVNPRTFEICGCGGFQLVDAASPVAQFFEPGRELVSFATVEEAKDKIRYYLAHESERRAVALAGQRRAHAEHTYAARIGAALQRVVEVDGPRVLARRLASRRELDACVDPSLKGAMEAVAAKRAITVEALAVEIESRTNVMGREELKVLFARELLR